LSGPTGSLASTGFLASTGARGSVGRDMNYLSGTERLANRYHAMRHGQSKANEAGVIVSRIETDRSGDWGLSELGRGQALATAERCGLPADTVICSSDFSRARQTAEIVRARLGAPAVTIAAELRERCFGDLEGTPASNYARVWQADNAGADNAGGSGTSGSAGGSTGGGIESADAVLDRATALIADLERRHSGRDVLLVSHGDTLQILQAGFLRMEASAHRRLPHLDTAEIRELRLGERPSGERPPPVHAPLF
jgi:broad specificity phosphatase PhoE